MSEKLSSVERLKKQRDQLTARIEKMQALEKTRTRKEETKRKILVGAYYLDLVEKNGTRDELITGLNHYLKRATDRALFGLEPLPTK